MEAIFREEGLEQPSPARPNPELPVAPPPKPK
jgi:hypothetical protein